VFSGIDLAKNLINEPGSFLTPLAVASIAEGIAKKHRLAIKVRKSRELEKSGYNGILNVGRGSQNEPAMVTLSYRPKQKNACHITLVGKGITFDTGGISLKPQDKMWEMKSDMSGAAIVLAAIQAVAQLKLPIDVDAVLCLAENRPGENAMLPGDIFKAKNGKTVMVENTDAEGRLVLIDGLAEAAELGATHVIDIATLTGAMQRALGSCIGGMFSNSEGLSRAIIDAGAENGEKWWRMPLDEEYAGDLKDKVADLRNITDGGPGAITAALFLKEFVKEGLQWAHLDIAGVAFTTKGYKYTEHGATAFGLKTLVEAIKMYSSEDVRR
jgi:leucyl aminopeptidase